MELIRVTADNLDSEHICCAIADKKGECCVSSKKEWLRARFAEGLVFQKLNVRGKVFIEYIPAEQAWCPILADGFLHINCFWVAGQFKGQGYGKLLLASCIADAKAQGKQGLTVLSSKKKMPFLSDPAFFKHEGFLLADSAAPCYELLYLPFEKASPIPQFRACAKEGRTAESGLVLYYSHQCPHTVKYVALIAAIAQRRGVSLQLVRFESAEQAQNAPAPFTTYSLFDGGQFVTNEILSEAKFEKFLDQRGS